jgi:hypothetical protein
MALNLLSDIITFVRRIIKSPSNAQITDNLLIDYINRFWIMDVDARIQLFDLKTKYTFQTIPGVDKYNMPLYSFQTEPGGQTIGPYPVYQGFMAPMYINGIQVPLQTQKSQFLNIWPNVVQQAPVVAVGNGGSTYSFTFPVAPNNSNPVNTPVNYILRGHVDMAGIMATGSTSDPIIGTTLSGVTATTGPNIPFSSIDPQVFIYATDSTGAPMVVSDSGQFLTGSYNYGLLMNQTQSSNLNPFGYSVLGTSPLGTYSTTANTVNYFTGAVNVTFPSAVPPGVNINANFFFFQTGLPRAALFYNNVLTLRSPPDTQYLVEVEAYLSPAAFLATGSAIPFGYMAEYISRGAARKILADTGDIEQFQFYEPLFKEQEMLVWKRSQRQFTASRSETIYSQGINQGQSGFNNIGGSTF